MGIISGSVSIIADAMNNLTDAGSSILVFIGYVVSAKPADKEHPFGHGRYEYVAGLGISVVILLVGIELLKSSAEKICWKCFWSCRGSFTSIRSLLVDWRRYR